MASDGKTAYYAEKPSSTSSDLDQPVAAGQVGKLRSRLPGFSLAVRQEESSFAATKNASNADFDPIPPSKRTWTWKAYIAYWMADAWAVSNWQVGKCSPTTVSRSTALRSMARVHECNRD